MRPRIRRFGPLAAAVAVMLLLSSCGEIGYYAQSIHGEAQILARREPISKVLADPATPPALRARLETVLVIRDFASRDLGLPDNGSYRCYADLGRPYVLWNVVATPEFSLTPVTWCFPIAGCVSYRGYFAEKDARTFAGKLTREGDDVFLYGVSAFSTLGWFDDPVLNTFNAYSIPRLAGLIFHELAHQRLYIKGDSAFDEAFAKTVEFEGVRRYLTAHGTPAERRAYEIDQRREDAFVALVLETRGRLAARYAAGGTPPELRAAKTVIFNAFRADYQQLKKSWGGYPGYDAWVAGSLNNARFASVSTYRTLVPAFRQLLRDQGGDLPSFYRAVAKIGHLSAAKRKAALVSLLREAHAATAEAD